MRAPRVLIAAALLAFLFNGCSKKSDAPTAPPPDNPAAPVVQFVADLQTTSQAVTLSPPDEDLGLNAVTIYFQHSGQAGGPIGTDFHPAVVLKGQSMTVHVTAPWTWTSSDFYSVTVSAQRPGQKLKFGLCCRGCDHTGGTLQLEPCAP